MPKWRCLLADIFFPTWFTQGASFVIWNRSPASLCLLPGLNVDSINLAQMGAKGRREGREDLKTFEPILIFDFKQSSTSSPQSVSICIPINQSMTMMMLLVTTMMMMLTWRCWGTRQERALPVRCDPFHQARPGKVAHHYLHIGPTLQFLQQPFYILVAHHYLRIGPTLHHTYIYEILLWFASSHISHMSGWAHSAPIVSELSACRSFYLGHVYNECLYRLFSQSCVVFNR